jgi:hypothetical protein
MGNSTSLFERAPFAFQAAVVMPGFFVALPVLGLAMQFCVGRGPSCDRFQNPIEVFRSNTRGWTLDNDAGDYKDCFEVLAVIYMFLFCVGAVWYMIMWFVVLADVFHEQQRSSWQVIFVDRGNDRRYIKYPDQPWASCGTVYEQTFPALDWEFNGVSYTCSTVGAGNLLPYAGYDTLPDECLLWNKTYTGETSWCNTTAFCYAPFLLATLVLSFWPVRACCFPEANLLPKIRRVSYVPIEDPAEKSHGQPHGTFDVFISHATADESHEIFKVVRPYLVASKKTVYNPTTQLSHVEKINKAAMQLAVKRSRLVIAAISEAFFASAWCEAEIEAAMEAGIKVIPVYSGDDHGAKVVDKWVAQYRRHKTFGYMFKENARDVLNKQNPASVDRTLGYLASLC